MNRLKMMMSKIFFLLFPSKLLLGLELLCIIPGFILILEFIKSMGLILEKITIRGID